MSRKQKKKIAPVAEVKEGSRGDKKTKKIIIICVCALLAAVMIFGAVYGIVSAVRAANYVMYYDGFGIDAGVASYLSSFYKARYMSHLRGSGIANVADTPEFWGTKVGINDNTYGDYLEYETEMYIKQLIAANVLFDMYTELSENDRRAIDIATDEILDFRHSGIKKDFNAATEKYGFDYDDFCDASTMLYKAWAAKTKIFGANGENMVSFPDLCEEYFASYTRAKLIFVRTETTFELDENGNRVKGEDGNDKLIPLTDAERAERERRLTEIRAAVNGINAYEIDPARFDELMEKYNEGDRSTHAGYYFNPSAEYTKEFSEEFEEIVTAARELSVGEATEVECSVGVCFIYRDSKAEGAYFNTDEDWCFSDFYSLAAEVLYQDMVEKLAKEIEVREKWDGISPVDIPYETEYNARF